jgi:hypothetical protein
VRLNKDEFDYIVDNGLCAKDGQKGPTPPAEKFVSFTSGAKEGPVRELIGAIYELDNYNNVKMNAVKTYGMVKNGRMPPGNRLDLLSPSLMQRALSPTDFSVIVWVHSLERYCNSNIRAERIPP